MSPLALKPVPADIETALATPDWRANAAWPIGVGEANQFATLQARNALAFIGGFDNGLARDAMLLALPNILAYARAIAGAAAAVSRAAGCGIELAGTAPEFTYIRTGEGEPPPRTEPVLPSSAISLPLARRAMRIKSWSSLARVPRALLAPDALAISHNSLLRSAAAAERRGIGFLHGESILERVRRRSARPGPGPRVSDFATGMVAALLAGMELEQSFLKRTRTLLDNLVHPHLHSALRDIQAMRSATLPMTVWSGSGGIYAARAIGLEVMRRGGNVVRYDHGTPKGFVQAREANAVVEFSVSSEFVLTTPAAAEICGKYTGGRPLGCGDAPALRGADGDPMFATLPKRRLGTISRDRLRVVYAPTQLLGFRELLPLQQPDVVHLKWQIHVAEALRDLPVEFICQPHPEGFFKGRPHPLESITETRRGDFHALLGSADVFVFDYPRTTALWEAVCTDARIVFLDLGAGGTMTPEVSRLFADRTRVLKVAHDERNCPVLDTAALRDAVLSEGDAVDPTPLRKLLAGED